MLHRLRQGQWLIASGGIRRDDELSALGVKQGVSRLWDSEQFPSQFNRKLVSPLVNDPLFLNSGDIDNWTIDARASSQFSNRVDGMH